MPGQNILGVCNKTVESAQKVQKATLTVSLTWDIEASSGGDFQNGSASCTLTITRVPVGTTPMTDEFVLSKSLCENDCYINLFTPNHTFEMAGTMTTFISGVSTVSNLTMINPFADVGVGFSGSGVEFDLAGLESDDGTPIFASFVFHASTTPDFECDKLGTYSAVNSYDNTPEPGFSVDSGSVSWDYTLSL